MMCLISKKKKKIQIKSHVVDLTNEECSWKHVSPELTSAQGLNELHHTSEALQCLETVVEGPPSIVYILSLKAALEHNGGTRLTPGILPVVSLEGTVRKECEKCRWEPAN